MQRVLINIPRKEYMSEIIDSKNLPADFLADFQTLQRELGIALTYPLYTLRNAKGTYENCST